VLRPAGTRQLLKLIDLRRSDLPLYQELADRLQGNEAEAERAATSIVEASPNEAENQAVMAELRQKQDRWAEAIPHWELVAEFRKLEPNGLLKLAEAQLHQKQWDAARATILKLRKTDWPARFNNVQFQASALESLIPK
jgi:tetratricopeptide (TPR) repeat protein